MAEHDDDFDAQAIVEALGGADAVNAMAADGSLTKAVEAALSAVS